MPGDHAPTASAPEREVALALQRAVLPVRPPEIPGLQVSARYVPGRGGAVGGDWYDVLPLPGGRVGVVIGDVSGHGLEAAVVMGRVRSALRAYALDSTDPAAVLSRLDAKLQHFEAGEMATVLYGVLEPGFGHLRLSCAGHLPPVVVGPGAELGALLPVAVDPPIGVATWASRRVTEVDVDPGAVVCLYTDGLVERRGRTLDEGIALLCAAMRADDPVGVATGVVEALVGTTVLEDDMALLVVAVEDLANRPLELEVSALAAVLAEVRAAARRWLSATPATDEEAQDLLVAMGEAAANSVEHAYGPAGGPLDVRLERVRDRVVATVGDRGRWRGPRGRHRGRGELLMRALCDDVDITHGAGTTVRLEKVLAGVDP